MNRAQRRAQKSEWAHRMKALHKDGAGVFSIEIIFPTSQPHPLGELAVLQWIAAAISGELVRPLCLDCDVEFSPAGVFPAAFMLITPARADPSMTSLTGICPACAARTHEELVEMAIRRARSIWPDARRLPPEHMHAHGGRA
jgi:hypothetical protein